MKNFIMAIFILLSACSYASEPPEYPIRVNTEGVAIDGYSPVSYFSKGIAEKGSFEFAIKHEGVYYWLTDTQQIEAFLLDPERYIPAHGGWCTLMMGGSGRRTPGHPESFSIVEDRLMLFWSGDTEETKGMGLRNWASKTHGDRDDEINYVAKADKKWTKFLEGNRNAQIYLYKESDKNGVNENQLAEAKIAF